MIFRVIVVVSEMAHPIDLRYKKHQDYAVVHLCNEGFYGSCHIVYVHLPIEMGTAMHRFSVLPFSGLLRFSAINSRDRDL